MNDHPLRAFRREQKLTLEALADKAGSTAATVSRIEKGVFRPTFDLLGRLVAATGGLVSADAILAHARQSRIAPADPQPAEGEAA